MLYSEESCNLSWAEQPTSVITETKNIKISLCEMNIEIKYLN